MPILSAAPTDQPVELDYRPSYLAAAIATAAVMLLYLITLAPTSSMWDTSEYITAAYTLGLPHPPGNPFFVLIGRVFAILPVGPTVAYRINVLNALASAISAGMWFLITERVLVSWFPQRWQRITGGALAALIGATAFTVWNQSVVNEKVYTLSLVGVAICAWLTVRWCDEPEGPTADRLLVLVAYLCGLGYSNHMAGMLAAPAVGLAVLIRRPQTVLRWKLLLACAAALVLGATPFATQPIRAAHFPAMNEGEPTGCVTKIAMDCTFSAKTYERFMYNFNRGQYGKPELSERQAPLDAQIGMWWLYFKWQWWRDAFSERPGVQNALAVFYLALGLIGGWVHFTRDRRSFWFFGPLMFTMTLALIFYMNFKYGHSQAPELGNSVPREVRDRDYFYLWSFSAWSVWAALGLLYLWETMATLFGADEVRLGRQTVMQPRTRSLAMASPVLALALIPLVGNWTQASRAGQTDTVDFARDLLNSVEPYGILITVGDNDTFPLWYAQEVEGIRKDVLIANTSLLNTDWYTRQIIRRPVFDYDAEKGPALYKSGTWIKPTGSPLKLSFDDADSIPLAIELPQAQQFTKGELTATLPQGILQRADLLVFYMIRDAFPDRPIYFSRTAGGYPQDLGLQEYVVTQGLARKLMPRKVEATESIVPAPGEGWMDMDRSMALWNTVFTAPASLTARKNWVDDASIGIPDLYTITAMTLAETAARLGKKATSDSMIAAARGIAKTTRRTEIFQLDKGNPLFGGDTSLQNLLVPKDTSASAPTPAKQP